jgi:hypothetical protein
MGKHGIWILAALLLAACSENPTAERPVARQTRAAAATVVSCPAGWTHLRSAPGVAFCRKVFVRRGAQVIDYLTVMNLKRGARLANAYRVDALATPRRPSPKFSAVTVADWWVLSRSKPNLFCTVNGAFFESYNYPTELSFPLRDQGTLITMGGSGKDYSRAIFVWTGTYASIQPYAGLPRRFDAGYQVLGPTSVVGFEGHYGRNGGGAHTFVAVKDVDGDRAAETVMFYVTFEGTPLEVGDVIARELRAKAFMQFDGGGSTQLQCSPTNGDSRGRRVPHAFAIYAAPS